MHTLLSLPNNKCSFAYCNDNQYRSACYNCCSMFCICRVWLTFKNDVVCTKTRLQPTINQHLICHWMFDIAVICIVQLLLFHCTAAI